MRPVHLEIPCATRSPISLGRLDSSSGAYHLAATEIAGAAGGIPALPARRHLAVISTGYTAAKALPTLNL